MSKLMNVGIVVFVFGIYSAIVYQNEISLWLGLILMVISMIIEENSDI